MKDAITVLHKQMLSTRQECHLNEFSDLDKLSILNFT